MQINTTNTFFFFCYSLSNRSLLILILIIYSLASFNKVLELNPEEKERKRGELPWWTDFTSMWLHSPYA